jgi:hypothetical protein
MRLAEARGPIRAYPRHQLLCGQLVRQQMWSPVAPFRLATPARLAQHPGNLAVAVDGDLRLVAIGDQ